MARAQVRLTMDQGELRALTSAPGRPVMKLVNDLGRRVTNSAKSRAPVDTGNLRNSISQGPTVVAGEVVSTSVTASAEYASYVHDGTRAHIIKPKNASVLRFTMRGKVVYAKSVYHPGTKGRPFLRNAVEATAPRLGFRVE